METKQRKVYLRFIERNVKDLIYQMMNFRYMKTLQGIVCLGYLTDLVVVVIQ